MSRSSRTRAVVATGLTLGTATAGLVFAPSASAAAAPLPALKLSTATVAVGDTLTVKGTDCLASGPDDIYGPVLYIDGIVTDPDAPRVLGQFDDEEGSDWTATFSFTDKLVGKHTIDAYCAHYNEISDDEAESTGHDLYPVANITVVAKQSANTGATTPAPSGTAAPSSSATPAATSTEFKPGARANTPGVASTTTSKTTGNAAAPGQKVVKVLKGFKPFEKVTVVLHSTPVELGTFTADANGVVTAEFTIPAGTALGQHTLAYEGLEGTYFEEPLTLTKDGKALAYTGADIKLPLVGGTVLLAAGAGALVVGRRRRTTGAAQA